MSKGINKVILIGNLGKDPESRFTSDGLQVVNLSIATSESWKDKSTGQKLERTEWHRVVMYGKVAEIAAEYLKKGSLVYLEGKLKTNKYKDKTTGIDKYSTEIICSEMQMLNSKQNTYDYSDSKQESSTLNNDFSDDDVPF